MWCGLYVTNAYCDNRFNRKPKKGVNFLQEQGLLGAGAGEVAEWLHVDDRLDKTGIGDFLGENEDFTKEVHTVCSLEPTQLKFQGNALVLRLRVGYS